MEKILGKNKFKEQLKALFRSFYRNPDKMVSGKEDIIQMSHDQYLYGIQLRIYDLIFSIVGMVFAFLLKMTNSAISSGMLVLGIMVYILYQMEPVLQDFSKRYRIGIEAKYELARDNDVSLKGGKIVGVTSGKVRKFYEEQGIFKVMSDEEVRNTLKRYLKSYWLLKITYWFDIGKVLVAVIMAILAILANDTVPQVIFVPMVMIGATVSFLASTYRCLYREEYIRTYKKHDNEMSKINNDMLRVPQVVQKDLDMRLNRLKKVIVNNIENQSGYYKGRNSANIILSLVHVVTKLTVVIFYICGKGIENLSLADITNMSAMLLILQNLLRRIDSIPEVMEDRYEVFSEFNLEMKDSKNILEVYTAEMSRTEKAPVIHEVALPPFEVRYVKESINDMPFTLAANDKIHMKQGDVVLLYGPSGAGKSTFMNLVTDRISLEKKNTIPATSRSLMYNEKLRFGSFSLYEELFCCEEQPNHEKMQYILENLHLWQELQENCKDIWQWMKEKNFSNSLSNGQKQRLILAKMLYFLNEDIDILALDEATSGLDDSAFADGDEANAEKILKFIVDYASHDKQRIILIATHQNISGFVQEILKDHQVKAYRFERGMGQNQILPFSLL